MGRMERPRRSYASHIRATEKQELHYGPQQMNKDYSQACETMLAYGIHVLYGMMADQCSSSQG
eukprot:7535534-Prorocentrum_lima.AAC.1